MDADLLGPLRLIRRLAPGMAERGAHLRAQPAVPGSLCCVHVCQGLALQAPWQPQPLHLSSAAARCCDQLGRTDRWRPASPHPPTSIRLGHPAAGEGCIINVGSLAGVQTMQRDIHYSAAKTGLRAWSLASYEVRRWDGLGGHAAQRLASMQSLDCREARRSS